MTGRRDIVAVIASGSLALGAVTGATAAPALAASTSSTATAPQQLVHQYPIGPQRLCCSGQTALSGTTGSSTQKSSAPPSPGTSAPRRRAQTPPRPASHGGSGGAPTVLLIGFGVLAILIIGGATAVYLSRRRTAPARDRGIPSVAADSATTGAEPAMDRSTVPAGAASDAEEQEFRRLDANGDAGGAFNLGVVLHQRGDVEGAKAAYERAEQRRDPDAAFNLGVLLYEADDLDGAEAAWRRSAGRGHVRAAANLLFLSRYRRRPERGVPVRSETPALEEFEALSYRRADESGAPSGAFNLGVLLHQQGDTAGAAAAYERAERRGDPDAAFNLGVLRYEAGDLDGAEAAWQRSAARGDAAAAENLEFLLRRRQEPKTAGVGGEDRDDR